VNSVYLTARSITYAQRMARALGKNGVESRIERPEREITDKGCAYAVVISEGYVAEALEILSYNRLSPVKAVIKEDGEYRVLPI